MKRSTKNDLYLGFLIIVVLGLVCLTAFGYGRLYERLTLKCGPAQCMKYQIQGEMSCIQHRGK